MNEKLVLKLVEPYLAGNVLSKADFDKVFSILPIYEQGQIIKFLSTKNIAIKETTDIEPESEFNIEEVLTALENDEGLDEKDKQRKQEEAFKDSISYEIIPRRNVKQSNEILCTLIQQGNKQAESDLCVKNVGLVRKYAYRYLGAYGHDLTFDDLIQAGYGGLLKAAEKFNASLGYAFTTYAVTWIMQSITRDIVDHGFTIRVPVHVVDHINKMIRVENKLFELGYDPIADIDRVALELDCSVEKVLEYRNIKNNFLRMASLNNFVGADETTELGEMIVDEETPSVEDACLREDCARIINEILKTLTKREEDIIRLRFGVDDGRERTLEEVGQVFGVTRERIRQIEAKALRKLRHPSRSRLIKDYVMD